MADPDENTADFADFVSARLPALLAYGYVLSGSRHDAQDLAQEALARAGARWGRIRRQGAAEAYVRTTMSRLQIDSGRKRSREWLTDRVPEPAQKADGIEQVISDAALWSALAELGPRQRAVVVLRYREQLSEAEIADRLGISVGTVKSQLSRALSRLRSTRSTERQEVPYDE